MKMKTEKKTLHAHIIQNELKIKCFLFFPASSNTEEKINQSHNRTLTKNVNVDVCRVRNKKKLNKMTFITLQKKLLQKKNGKPNYVK